MIKFGPSGMSPLFVEEGGSGKTIDVPRWLKGKGLTCYEYSFGKGVRMSRETAEAYGKAFAEEGVEISVHAPYYINLATEEEKADNNVRYIIESVEALKALGGNRCVFHPGALKKMDRREAMDLAKIRLEKVLSELYANGYSDVKLAVEVMGKLAQLGTDDEIIEFCNMDSMLYPCVDFGHQNARTCGSLKSKEDYLRLLDKFIDGVGYDKTNNMHVHFSKIQYTAKGEVKHLTFEDSEYGPEFEPLAEALIERNLNPYMICESAGTQTIDAIYMRDAYNKALNK